MRVAAKITGRTEQKNFNILKSVLTLLQISDAQNLTDQKNDSYMLKLSHSSDSLQLPFENVIMHFVPISFCLLICAFPLCNCAH